MVTLGPTIDAPQVLAALERVVERHGAHTTYRDRDRDPEWEPPKECRYVRDGAPCCIVGTVLHEEFDVSLEDLTSVEGRTAMTLKEGPFDPISPDARHVLARAQRTQDNGLPWGQALDAARTYVRVVRAT